MKQKASKMLSLLFLLMILVGIGVYYLVPDNNDTPVLEEKKEKMENINSPSDTKKKDRPFRSTIRSLSRNIKRLQNNVTEVEDVAEYTEEDIPPDELEKLRRGSLVAREIRGYGKDVYADNARKVLEELFSKQVSDAEWGRETETVVQHLLKENDTKGVHTKNVNCGETICMVELAFESNDVFDNFDEMKIVSHEYFNDTVMGTNITGENGEKYMKFYFQSDDEPFAFYEIAEVILDRLKKGEIVPI